MAAAILLWAQWVSQSVADFDAAKEDWLIPEDRVDKVNIIDNITEKLFFLVNILITSFSILNLLGNI